MLGLILFFWHALWMAAALWGVLAFGDGMATVVGQTRGGTRLPWNREQGLGGLPRLRRLRHAWRAAVLMAWTSRLPLELASWHAPRTLGLAFCLALVCALVESLPTTLDDNLTVPLAGALVLPLFAQAEPRLLLGDPALAGALAVGLVANGVVRGARRSALARSTSRAPLGRRHRHRDHRRRSAFPASR